MNVGVGRRVALPLSFACLLLPVLTGAAAAQTPVTKEMLQVEGKLEQRNLYYESRRQGPDDAHFNPSEARFRAYRIMKDQEAALNVTEGVVPSWINIGPAPTTNGQTPTFPPRFPSDVSGRTNAIAIDATNGFVFVGGAQGGVWRSPDRGTTWTALSDDLGSLAIGTIALDPSNPATVYIGTGEGNGSGDSYSGVGVYKSTDSGNTWAGPFGSTEFLARAVNSIVVDRNDSNHLLCTSASGVFGVAPVTGPVLADRGIFESNDGGMTWVKRTDSIGTNIRGSRIMQDPATATTWWGAMWTSGGSIDPANEGGLLQSTDNGATWFQRAGTGGLPPLATSWSRAWITGTMSVAGGSVLYLANGQSSGSVWRSDDGGATWTNLPAATGFCSGQCFYDMPIYTEPGNPDVLYTGGAGDSTPMVLPSQFMRSTDGGQTFQDKVRSNDMTTAMHADVHAITTWPGIPNELWTANDGGVWTSTDRGDNWINVNFGLATLQFSGCDIDPVDPARAYGGTQDNGTMGWTGMNAWPHLDFGDGGYGLIDQVNTNNLVHTYFNISNGLIGVGWTTGGFATTQGFYNFSSAPANGIMLSDRVLFYAPIHLDRGVSDTLYFGTHRLYQAPDFFTTGGGFVALGGGMDLAPGGGAISAIDTLASGTPGQNAQVIFTGANNGAVFRTTDGGANWTQVDVGGSPLFVSDVVMDPNNPLLVYQSRSGFAGSDGQNVRKSTDGGDTWAVSGSGIPDIPVNAFAVDPLVTGRLWAGTDLGMYLSTDAGANWIPFNQGMANVAVFDLKSNAATESIIACTHGRSVYRLELDFGTGGVPIIPALSGRGLMLLALAILAMATFALRRRRVHS